MQPKYADANSSFTEGTSTIRNLVQTWLALEKPYFACNENAFRISRLFLLQRLHRFADMSSISSSAILALKHRRLIVEALRTVVWTSRKVAKKSYRDVLAAASPQLLVILPRGEVRRIARAVGIIAQLIPGATCLPQALAVQHMLSRRGMKSTIVIGVMEKNKKFDAHAWIVDRGQIIIGGSPDRVSQYNPITTLDTP